MTSHDVTLDSHGLVAVVALFMTLGAVVGPRVQRADDHAAENRRCAHRRPDFRSPMVGALATAGVSRAAAPRSCPSAARSNASRRIFWWRPLRVCNSSAWSGSLMRPGGRCCSRSRLRSRAVYAQVTVNDIVLARYTPPAWRGRIYALRFFLIFTSAGPAVWGIGKLYDRGGFDLVLLATADHRGDLCREFTADHAAGRRRRGPPRARRGAAGGIVRPHYSNSAARCVHFRAGARVE